MKVLLIILAVLALLLYLPVGVDVGYTGGQVLLRVRAGALAFTVLPRKAGKKKSKKPKKQSPAEQKSGQPKEKRKLPVTKDDILDAAELLIRSIKKLRFRVSRLKLHFVSAFDDPYNTAMVYGYVCAAVNALRMDRVKGADIQLSADFMAEHWSADAACSITIRIWYMMKFVCSVLAGGIPILLRIRKRMKPKQSQVAQPAGKEA